MSLRGTFSNLIYLRVIKKNMVKVLCCRFKECLGTFNMLTVKRCFETVLFRNFSNHVFRSLQFRKYIKNESHFLLNMLKFHWGFTNAGKSLEIFFCFLDNCIWIGSRQFSLLGRKYFSWAVIVLTKSPKISDITKSDNFQLNIPQSDLKNDKSALLQTSAVFGNL